MSASTSTRYLRRGSPADLSPARGAVISRQSRAGRDSRPLTREGGSDIADEKRTRRPALGRERIFIERGVRRGGAGAPSVGTMAGFVRQFVAPGPGTGTRVRRY